MSQNPDPTKNPLKDPTVIYAIQRLDGTASMRAPYLILKGFVSAGWNAEVVTQASPENAAINCLWGSVPVRKVAGAGKGGLLNLGLRLLWPRRKRIVISWVWHWHCFALAFAKILFGTPYVIVLDTFSFKASGRRRDRLREELRYGLVLRNANVILAETPGCWEHARSHVRRPLCLLVPSCYWQSDLSRVEAQWESEGFLPGRKPVVLYAGRILRRKNIHDLIAAFSRICPQHPEWTLEVRGSVKDEDYYRELQAQVISLNLIDRVRFGPPVFSEDLFRLYRETSIFALPSEGEGFPSAIIEAMYFGGAIVASPSGYVAYQMGDGDCGLYHNSGDVDGLACCLDTLMSSPETRQWYMDNARRPMMEMFTWERYFPDVESVFRRLAGAGESPPAVKQTHAN